MYNKSSGCLWLHMWAYHIGRYRCIIWPTSCHYTIILPCYRYLYIRLKAISIMLDVDDEPSQFPAVRKCSNRKGRLVFYTYAFTYNIKITYIIVFLEPYRGRQTNTCLDRGRRDAAVAVGTCSRGHNYNEKGAETLLVFQFVIWSWITQWSTSPNPSHTLLNNHILYYKHYNCTGTYYFNHIKLKLLPGPFTLHTFITRVMI